MATIQSQAGSLPSARQTAGTPVNPGGTFGESLFSELTPQYYALLKASKVFSISALAANPTAFTGGAAGTPLLGLYNPASSGVDLVLLQVRYGVRTTGTAAVTLDFSLYGANQGGVAVTGTQTQARNMYSQANTGSSAYAMVNTANTAALASTLIAPSLSNGLTATTAITNAGIYVDDIKGAIIVSPGTYIALGASATPTAASIDCVLIWAEIPA
jgi:hypothetical protein